MRKVYTLINIVLVVAVLIIAGCFFQTRDLVLKGLSSVGFVLMGTFNWRYCKANKAGVYYFPILTVTGLFLSMCADVILNLHFIIGVFLFASAHIFYILAYCLLLRLNKYDLVQMGSIALVTVLFILIAPIWDFDKPILKYVCIVYAVIVSSMLGKSVSNLFRNRNMTNIILAIGGGLFYISDLLLAINMFTDVAEGIGIFSLMTYYIAQCMIASSILCYGVVNSVRTECTVCQ